MTLSQAAEHEAVESVLADVGRDVRRVMLAAIPDGEPHSWLYRLVRDYPSRPGKAIRPSLCLAACRAFGGTDAAALPLAASIEMLHNAFLIHDDVADASEQRRGAPTLPAAHGDGLALNAGDALAVFAYQLLRRHLSSQPQRVADRVFAEFDTMATRTLEGQATELGWRRDHTVDLEPEDYLRLILLKTCWYTTIHPLRVGALVGSQLRADVRPMVRFGFYLGAAFQIRDDLLNLVGEPAAYGKETNGDLYEGKRTLMLIHLARNATGSEGDVVRRYLATSRSARTAGLVAEIRGLMDRYGSIEFASDYGQGIASAALGAFDEAFATAEPSADTEFIRGLVPFMLSRNR